MSRLLCLLTLVCATTLNADDKADKPKTIKYEVIDTETVKNKDKSATVVFRQIIVVDRKHVNEADLRALGDQLREDLKKERARNLIVDVRIFDDAKAARMWRKAIDGKLDKKDDEYHDKHWLGEYFQNRSTKLFNLSFSLDPPEGKSITVKYKD